MPAPQGIIRFHQQDRTVTFQVEGRGTMNQSLPLRRCAERCLKNGTNRVCVDLARCTYMDSTFLGTLLTLHKTLTQNPGGELILIAPSLACSKILQQMGLADVFPPGAVELPADVTWTELAGEDADPGSFKRNIAQAHEELANLPGPAGEQFKAVVRCMAKADAEKPANQPASPPHE
jgi:anti-sigma B factor antagonist